MGFFSKIFKGVKNVFKKVVHQIDQMEVKDKEAMATYFVKNINTTEEVNN